MVQLFEKGSLIDFKGDITNFSEAISFTYDAGTTEINNLVHENTAKMPNSNLKEVLKTAFALNF